MAKLLSNYQEMKSNFNDLMSNLKSTNTDQAKIIRELNTLKEFYQNKESNLKKQAQTKEEQRRLRDLQKEEKNKKLTEMRQEIERAKEGAEKDLLYLKIN